MLLDRRRRDLENSIHPTVTRISKGSDAPTDSGRTAHETTHLPPSPWRETCVFGRGIETPQVTLTGEKARAEDGESVDDDLGTFLGIVGFKAPGCTRANSSETKRATEAQWQIS